LCPDLDNFLFAVVGAERDGIPLSMISALTRLGLEPRKASQRNTRRAGQSPTRIVPILKPGDAVRWKARGGAFRRDVGDSEHAEIALADRIYRVRLSELG
jgi:hypothetical protein